MIKALSKSDPKPKTEPKQTPKPEPKPEPKTKLKPKPKLKTKTKLKPEPKIDIKVNRKKLEKLRKDFDELRHKFSNKDEIKEYRKAFYNAKKYKFSESEIEEVRKNLNKLKKSMKSKKFEGNIDSVDFKDLDNYNNYDFADDDKYRKIGNIRTLFKEFDSDYYKPRRTDDGFAGKKNNYIEYKSNRDRYENLSPKEYLDMIRPYLRDLINNHKTSMKSNNNNNNNNKNTDRAEWKILLVMQNNFISDKNFEDTRTKHSASKPVEIFMGSDTENTIDTLFNTILDRIQQAIETLNKRGSGFTHESVALLYYYFQKIDIRRGGSYIMSPDWIASKTATTNPKNKKR